MFLNLTQSTRSIPIYYTALQITNHQAKIMHLINLFILVPSALGAVAQYDSAQYDVQPTEVGYLTPPKNSVNDLT